MVCVTDSDVYVFALRSPMGNDPEELLAKFDRAGAQIEVKKFLGAKHLHIAEGDDKLYLQGSTARISPDAGGDKSVLEVARLARRPQLSVTPARGVLRGDDLSPNPREMPAARVRPRKFVSFRSHSVSKGLTESEAR